MPKKRPNPSRKIALISTPWPLYTRPSIQLGALKAYIASHLPDVTVDAHHLYVALAEAIGYKCYHDISERTWLAESIYAALLYPKRFRQIEKLYSREANRSPLLKKTGLKNLTVQIEKTSREFIDRINWESIALAGFSVSLCQLTSSLYFIKTVKLKHPKLITVIGGSSFSANSAGRILNLFPEIDVVVTGEGELPFRQFIQNLDRFKRKENFPGIKGIHTRLTDTTGNNHGLFSQIESLEDIPIPDYDDYFELLKSFHPQKSFFPTLPVEISRGCWWKRTAPDKKSSGCAFCNLNLQWSGYRSKKTSQVVSEIDHLTTTYKTLSLAIMDNVLPKDSSGEIFKQLKTLKKDLRLFSEIRATTPLTQLRSMREAGMQEVQVGIEALSTGLLKKLKKGTTAIQNLEIMKNCEALGIANISNLILQFPGSDENDVRETLRNMEFAIPFRPLKMVNFWLGLDSPVWQYPEAYGVKAVFNHPNWRYLFPANIYQTLPFMIQAYRGDVGVQKKVWPPVKKKAETWSRIYNELKKEPWHTPILSFRDGRDFLIIRQRRFQAEPMTHRLVGPSRSIYLFCQHHRSLKRICDQFSSIKDDKIIAFLKMMVDKKLMFAENDKYLSLAVPINI
jgi:ribosomal peptide maturation radical SAM protein 1